MSRKNHTGSASTWPTGTTVSHMGRSIKLPQEEARVTVLGTRDNINGYGTSVTTIAQGYQREGGKVYRKKGKEGEGPTFYVHEFLILSARIMYLQGSITELQRWQPR